LRVLVKFLRNVHAGVGGVASSFSFLQVFLFKFELVLHVFAVGLEVSRIIQIRIPDFIEFFQADLLVSSIAHSILEESPLLWAQLILHIAHHGNLFVNLAFTCIYVRMKALLQVVIRPRRWIVGVFSFFGITRLLKTKEERRVESKRREKGKMNVLKVGCQMAALDIRSFLIAAIPYLAWLT